jgi:hypothetical protein
MSQWYGVGCHIANIVSPPESMYQALAVIQPRLLSVMGYHGRAVYDRCETICDNAPVYLCRIGQGRMDQAGILTDYQRARREVPERILTDGRWLPRLLNEVNHRDEGYADEPEVYAQQFRWLAGQTSEPLGLANLTLGTVAAGDPVAMDWPVYLARLEAAGAVQAAGWVALSLYGDMADPARLGPYLGLGRTLLAVEFGVPWYRDAERIKWWQWRGEQLRDAGIGGLCVYILGGETGGQWPSEYILNDVEVAGVATVDRWLQPYV